MAASPHTVRLGAFKTRIDRGPEALLFCGDVIHFKLRECVQNMLRHLPEIAYDLAQRQYLFGGSPFDVPAESRKRPVFSISHVPVTVVFPQL